eukprot:s38_g13.t1
MWHGLVEAPSAATVDVGKPSAPCRALYQDEVEQLIPVELRRSRPNANIGQPPADRIVKQVQQEDKAPKLVDISAMHDSSLCKRILVEPEVGSPAVLPGAAVRAKITATLGDEKLPLEQRLLHGPKEHSWTAGSGTHCQLLELMVCSMQLGETCTSSSSDERMMADSSLLGRSTIIGEVEFVVSLSAVSDCRLESAHGVIQWAGEQKTAAANVLQRGLLHLSLLQYSVIVRELTHLMDGGGLGDVVVQEAQSLRLASRLNRSLCLLRLGMWQRAAEACTEVLQEEDGNLKALFRRGKALLQLGKTREATADLAQANQLDPDNREVAQQLRQCQGLLKKAADKATVLEKQRSKDAEKWG